MVEQAAGFVNAPVYLIEHRCDSYGFAIGFIPAGVRPGGVVHRDQQCLRHEKHRIDPNVRPLWIGPQGSHQIHGFSDVDSEPLGDMRCGER